MPFTLAEIIDYPSGSENELRRGVAIYHNLREKNLPKISLNSMINLKKVVFAWAACLIFQHCSTTPKPTNKMPGKTQIETTEYSLEKKPVVESVPPFPNFLQCPVTRF